MNHEIWGCITLDEIGPKFFVDHKKDILQKIEQRYFCAPIVLYRDEMFQEILVANHEI